MMKNRIKNLNVRAKKYETNHSVKLMVDGIEVSAMFDCFTVCSLEEVEFVVVTEDKQTFEFKYIFESGKLICLNTTQSVEVAGLLSERHLCSFLFYARDYALREKSFVNEMTEFVHKKYPMPIVWLDNPSMKRYFKIDNVVKCNMRELVLDGVLAMKIGGVFCQPVNAKCRYTLKDGLFEWTFQDNGKLVSIKEKDRCEFNSKVKIPSTLLDEYMRGVLVEKRATDKYDRTMHFLDKGVLDIMKEKKLLMFSIGAVRMGMSGCVDAYITGVKSMDEKEIKFHLFDTNTLNDILIYDRLNKRIYHRDYGKKHEYGFAVSREGQERRFKKVIKYIETRMAEINND